MIFNYLLILFVGVILGGLLKNWSNKLSEKITHNKLILDRNKQFKQILEKINTKRSRFKTRINNTVYIGVKLEDYGRVDVIYFLDKKENQLNIFKGDKLIMTSDLVFEELLNEIMSSINRVHYHRIVDVVEILGLVFYREDFERSFGVSFQELKEKSMNMMKSMSEDQSDIQKIINKNNTKLDIDIFTGSFLQPDRLMISLPTKTKGTYHFDDKPLVLGWIPLSGSTGGGGYTNSYPGCYADITITSVSSDLVTGTFSGKLFKDGNIGSYVTITNGTFQACKN